MIDETKGKKKEKKRRSERAPFSLALPKNYSSRLDGVTICRFRPKTKTKKKKKKRKKTKKKKKETKGETTARKASFTPFDDDCRHVSANDKSPDDDLPITRAKTLLPPANLSTRFFPPPKRVFLVLSRNPSFAFSPRREFLPFLANEKGERKREKRKKARVNLQPRDAESLRHVSRSHLRSFFSFSKSYSILDSDIISKKRIESVVLFLYRFSSRVCVCICINASLDPK